MISELGGKYTGRMMADLNDAVVRAEQNSLPDTVSAENDAKEATNV